MKKYIKDIFLTLVILASSFGVSLILQDVLTVREHITTVFVFAVFLVSVVTDGYIFGIISAVIGMLAVNFAFTFPYFAFNFTIPENALSALVMIIVSLMTSTLTTKLKKWQVLKAEGEREKMRANLLRAVSHDLRTPLTTIYGSSSTIIEGYDSLTDEQKRKMLSGIKADSQWLIRMVENLLSITRIDGGNVKLIKIPTVLEELIDDAVLKFKKRYPEQNVDIDIPGDMVLIPMDALLIEQVIINILENAVQHARGMDKLSLRVFVIDEKAVFEISDNGCGIPKEKLDTVFSAYYTESSDTNNTGIGLSVCSAIIKAHGGNIRAENAKSGGAVFRFTLDTKEEITIE